jgi:hypothetical protein
MRDGKRHLGGQLTGRAYDGWYHYARTQGTTVAALLETIGLWLAETDQPGEPWPTLAAQARDLAAERRLGH